MDSSLSRYVHVPEHKSGDRHYDKEGTKYQESIFYPQVMDSHTLNDKIEPWEFFKRDDDQCVCFRSIDMADEYIENQRLMDIPVKTIIHPVN